VAFPTVIAPDTLVRPAPAAASVLQPQTALPGASIPKYVTPLTTFRGRRVRAPSMTTSFVEFPQHVLPPSVYPRAYAEGTWVWGYQVADGPASWPGYTVEAFEGCPGEVTYPPGTAIPGYGPPRDCLVPNADGALGGNPAFGPHLTGPVLPPGAHEAGWKDTVNTLPGVVTRVIARWAPTATPVGAVAPGENRFAFDPTSGPGYVWHCHIVDHEDNEMMRPYAPTRRPSPNSSHISMWPCMFMETRQE
jgi:hypothetical protein